MKDISIDVNALGAGRFVIDGQDISDRVTRVEVVVEPGRLTRVTFEVMGDMALDAKQAEIVLERTA